MFKFIYKYRLHLIAGFILASILLLFINATSTIPSIINSSIKDGQTNILLDTSLDLTFSVPLSSKERRRLTFVFTPQLPSSPIWDKTSTIVRLITPSLFTKNTHYSIKVLYQNKPIYTISFTTNPYDKADLIEQGKKQALDDLIFGQKVSESLKKRPWLSSLPIRTPSYYIYFDTPSQKFLFYFVAPQTPALEQQAVDALKKIGVPTQDLKYTVVN